jgi:hypothetical protein
MAVDHMALGQGGLSNLPMWADRVAEIRALRPRLIRLFSDHPALHGLVARDEQLRTYNLVLWNFTPSPVSVQIALNGLPANRRLRHIILNATTQSSDENFRLQPEPFERLAKTDPVLNITFDPYAIHYWCFE